MENKYNTKQIIAVMLFMLICGLIIGYSIGFEFGKSDEQNSFDNYYEQVESQSTALCIDKCNEFDEMKKNETLACELGCVQQSFLLNFLVGSYYRG